MSKKLLLDCDIDPGDMNVLITFLDKDAGGEFYNVEVGKVFASVKIARGKEDDEASQLKSKTDYMIKARYPDAFVPKPDYRLSVPNTLTATPTIMRITSIGDADFTNRTIVIEAQEWAEDNN